MRRRREPQRPRPRRGAGGRAGRRDVTSACCGAGPLWWSTWRGGAGPFRDGSLGPPRYRGTLWCTWPAAERRPSTSRRSGEPPPARATWHSLPAPACPPCALLLRVWVGAREDAAAFSLRCWPLGRCRRLTRRETRGRSSKRLHLRHTSPSPPSFRIIRRPLTHTPFPTRRPGAISTPGSRFRLFDRRSGALVRREINCAVLRPALKPSVHTFFLTSPPSNAPIRPSTRV